MNKTDLNFIPLLFAGDINVYSVARAFHEAYGVTSYCYGKFASGPCMDSKIINYTPVLEADQDDTYVALVKAFAADHADKKIFLIGCGDSYVELAAKHKAEFPENVIAPYIDYDFMQELINKEKFYELCEKKGIPYPNTFIFKKGMDYDVEIPFAPPYAVKASSSIKYWEAPFEGQKKAYRAESYEEFQQIAKQIYDAGYQDNLIVQDFIPGDDSYMRVLTNYSDKNGKCKMTCLGHVLLEEHTPHGIGNHALIFTEHNEEIEERFRSLLDDLGFVGFSNFDIKYDERDGEYKVFEINTRQGRSNYYVTNSGANIATYLVRDYILNEEMEYAPVTTEHLWSVVPDYVIKHFVKKAEYRETCKRLKKAGKGAIPLKYSGDTSFKRSLRTAKNYYGQILKFRKYMK